MYDLGYFRKLAVSPDELASFCVVSNFFISAIQPIMILCLHD